MAIGLYFFASFSETAKVKINNFFKQILLSVLLLPQVSWADGLFEYLATASYRMTHAECSAFNNLGVAQQLAAAGTERNCPSLYNISPATPANVLKKASEKLFFDLSRVELKEKILCEQTRINRVFNPLRGNDELQILAKDIEDKVPVLNELDREIEKRISRFQVIYGNLPKNPNIRKLSPKDAKLKAQAEQLNNEIKQLMFGRQSVLESIPFSRHPEFAKYIDGLTEKSLQDKEKFHAGLKIAAEKVLKSFEGDLEKISRMEKNPEAEAPREFKERVAQNPEFIEHVLARNKINPKEFQSLRCEIDAKYGSGAEARDMIGTVASMLATGGTAGLTMNLALKVPMRLGAFYSRPMIWYSGASLAATATETVRTIKSECVPEGTANLIYSRTPGAPSCDDRDIRRSLQENNCGLAIALPAFGATVSGLLYTQKMPMLLERLKDSKVAQKIRSEKTPASTATEVARPTVTPAPQVTKHQFQRYQNLASSGKLDRAKSLDARVTEVMTKKEIEDLGAVGAGVDGARYVKFSDGTYGIWKPAKITDFDVVVESAPYEVAAYKVDRFLGYNRVPTTVLRDMDGKKGSVQLMVGDINESVQKVKDPDELKLFDYLIANQDRNPGNYLVTNDGRIVAIDHARTFKGTSGVRQAHISIEQRLQAYDKVVELAQGEGKVTASSAAAAKKFDSPIIQEEEKRAIKDLQTLIGEKESYRKLKLTPEYKWRSLLKELNNSQIEAFLQRKENIVRAVEEAHKKFGDRIFKPASQQ